MPYYQTAAIDKKKKKGPGMKLFSEVKRQLNDMPIIAEDLGFLTPEVHQLLDDSGYPGMKVLEFAFDSRDTNGPIYYPHCYPQNCVAYCGTHDNEPIMGWLKDCDPVDLENAKKYMLIENEEDFNWKMISVLMMSVADTTILQAQAILGLGHESRMNTPSTTGNNWKWRALPDAFNKELANKLAEYTIRYAR